MAAQPLYGDDLAQIHIDGYGFHWENAAPTILAWLREAEIASGTVLDLGCGGGQWLAALTEAGYSPVGVDASLAMIRAAKKCAPKANLLLGSFDKVALPPCDAVTSLGEPISYLASAAAIRRTFRKVYAALRPGGLFVFDLRDRPMHEIAPRTGARLGKSWACLFEVAESAAAGTIVRRITTFRVAGGKADGVDNYRRGEEVHRLTLLHKSETLAALRKLGFRVRTFPGYGKYRLAPRHTVYVARKPSSR